MTAGSAAVSERERERAAVKGRRGGVKCKEVRHLEIAGRAWVPGERDLYIQVAKL